jgi:hypothetical protein
MNNEATKSSNEVTTLVDTRKEGRDTRQTVAHLRRRTITVPSGRFRGFERGCAPAAFKESSLLLPSQRHMTLDIGVGRLMMYACVWPWFDSPYTPRSFYYHYFNSRLSDKKN